MIDTAIILAGGSGTRLWPVSTPDCPKQFLDPGIGRSLLVATLERVDRLSVRGEIVIVTLDTYVEQTIRECATLPAAMRSRIEILPQPQDRNTASAIAYSLRLLHHRPEQTSVVLPADHLIGPIETFADDVEVAGSLAREGWIVTIGIPPSRAEIGYGYIETGRRLETGRGEGGFEVATFREKPDRETARRYLEGGRHFWNAGIFVYRNSTLWEELQTYMPEMAQAFLRSNLSPTYSSDGVAVRTTGADIVACYRGLPSTSIDYAIMEKTTRAAMIPARFGWNDIGGWDEIAALKEAERLTQRNGAIYEIESANNFVFSDRQVALCGVHDLIVVTSEDRLLICRKGSAQLLKSLKNEMQR